MSFNRPTDSQIHFRTVISSSYDVFVNRKLDEKECEGCWIFTGKLFNEGWYPKQSARIRSMYRVVEYHQVNTSK